MNKIILRYKALIIAFSMKNPTAYISIGINTVYCGISIPLWYCRAYIVDKEHNETESSQNSVHGETELNVFTNNEVVALSFAHQYFTDDSPSLNKAVNFGLIRLLFL